jgi:shikimate dehydrogenase
LLAHLRQGDLQGLNVTIPHKQNVLPWLEQLTPAARAIGAVNTLYMHQGQLSGDNTDAPGFIADLRRVFPTLWPASARRHALVLGAGGSARAVVYALLQDGWQVSLAARRPAQAAQLVAELAPSVAGEIRAESTQLIPWEASALAALTSYQLLVNTTPLGMQPQTSGCPWPPDLPLPTGVHVYDLVYNPRQTTFVARALAQGLPAASGLGMLIEQAALAFERWTGCAPPRSALWQAVSSILPVQELL